MKILCFKQFSSSFHDLNPMIKWHPKGSRLVHPLEHDMPSLWSDKLPFDGCLLIWLVFCVCPVNKSSIGELDNYLLANER